MTAYAIQFKKKKYCNTLVTENVLLFITVNALLSIYGTKYFRTKYIVHV